MLKSTIMAFHPNHSAKFRAALKGELPAWVEQGLVTEAGAQQLRAAYQLDALGKESSRLLTAVLFTIGSLLIGGGIISFVAAHWNEIAPGPKVAALFSALLAFHLGGYWLRYRSGWPQLGHALLFCGCLVFGANIGLLAQIYQISGAWYGMFGAWALGALAMAWAARSWITGLLLIATSFTWFCGFADDHHERLAAAYPVLLVAALLPLAWALRSRVLYIFTLLAFVAATFALAIVQLQTNRYSLLAVAAGSATVWAIGTHHQTSRLRAEFGAPALGLSLATLAVSAYFWSFRDAWRWGHEVRIDRWQWMLPVGAALLIGIALTVRAWPRLDAQHRQQTSCLATIFVLICLAPLVNRASDVVPVIMLNLAAVATAAVTVGKAMDEERRWMFWAGSLFLATLVITRFFEYESSLLLKAAAFVVCGLVTIASGIAYEKFLRRREVLAQ